MNKARVKKYAISTIKTVMIPLIIYIIFVILTKGRMLSMRTVITTLKQSFYPTIICWGIILCMSVGMMNFAAGGLILAATIIGGNLMKLTGTGFLGYVLFTLLIALILSALTGLLYNKMRIPSIVLTIGLVLTFEALPRALFSGGVMIPARVTFLAQSPYCYVIILIMFILFYVIYNKTVFGYNLRAIGSNQAIANSVGLDSDRIKFTCFMVTGIFLGVAAILYGSIQGEIRNVTSLGSMLIMMDAFMSMFLAFFLAKFCNLTIAVFVATFTMKLINIGFVAMGVQGTVRDITTGLLLMILLAVSANEGMFERMKANRKYAEAARAKYKSRQEKTERG